MVIGLLTVAAIPTVIGVGQAVSAQKKQNAAAKEQEKFHIAPELPNGEALGDGAFCVLKDGKVCTIRVVCSHPTHKLIFPIQPQNEVTPINSQAFLSSG